MKIYIVEDLKRAFSFYEKDLTRSIKASTLFFFTTMLG